MGFHDVAILPIQANFDTTFLKHCGRGESPVTTTCVKTVVVVSKGMLPVRYLFSSKASFYVSRI